MPGEAAVKGAGQMVVATIAAAALGAGVLRHAFLSGASASPPKLATGLAAAPAALPMVAPTDPGATAMTKRLYLLHHDLGAALEKQNRSGTPLSPENRARFQDLQVRIQDLSKELTQTLGRDPDGWSRVLQDLAPFSLERSARTIMEEIRDGLDASVAQSLSTFLGSANSEGVRRLALVLLQNQRSREVTSGLLEMAERDPVPLLRKEALEVLAFVRMGLREDEAPRREIEESFRRISSAEPDQGIRSQASQFLVSPAPPPQAKNPPPRRGPFGP